MYTDAIPRILLRALQVTGCRVRSTGRVGRTKAGAACLEKVCQRICRAAEKLAMVRMFGSN
ncbi:hypothetical protein [Paenibacillus apiarius]|uniref:hypothetical protein n=1 Tax=Paenibacillus apiarius TaxID=46240 RepID=UPI003B3A273B